MVDSRQQMGGTVVKIENLSSFRFGSTRINLSSKFTASLRRCHPIKRFGLCSQMQRAAVSIPANIAEGFKRHSPADKIRFYNIAQASLEELRYYFILCRDLGYRFDYEYTAQSTESIARMLAGVIRSVRG
jgi:four helix bundle protein